MYKDKTIAVVVPAYNEAGFVGEVLETIPPFVDRIYAVDDDSTDDTWEEIRRTADLLNSRSELALADGGQGFERRVVPIRHEENRGVGGAIKTGYLRARDDRIDVTAVMGGDGQMDPARLTDILDPVIEGDADYAKGNRLVNAADHGSMPTHRYIGNRLLTYLTKVASGYWKIGDPQNGYTAISLRALDEAAVDEMYEFYGYCNDILVKLNVSGMRVVDVPAPITYADETSHINYSTYIPKVSGMLFRNFLWRLRHMLTDRDPYLVVLLYVVGGLSSVAGVAVLTAALGLAAFTNVDISAPAAAVLLVTGVTSLLGAVLLDRKVNEPLCGRW